MAADYKSARTFKNSTEAMKAMGNSYLHEFWWNIKDPEERANSMWAQAQALETNSSERHQANLRHARLYENCELENLAGSSYAMAIVQQSLRGRGIVRMNVIAACEDTLAAKITKNKPRPTFLTSGASWTYQMKARKLDKFTRGMFYELDYYETAKEIAMDAFTFGTGIGHLYKGDEGRVAMERVLPDEIYVDDDDARYGKPRMMMRRKFINREVLLAAYPDKEEMLLTADDDTTSVGAGAGANSTKMTRLPQVEVWEAWHLPSGKKAEDGMHIICTSAGELFCEPWKLDQFPFVVCRYKKRTVGFWGKGIAESLVGIQLELNRLFLSISEQLRRKGRGRLFLQKGSQVNPAHLTNAIADIVWYTGQPPIVDSGNAVAPEEFMQIDRLYRAAFQEIGISELSAASKKPSGLDAAVAMREFSDIESERFALVHQEWENLAIHTASLSLELIHEQYGNKGYKMKMPSKRYVIDVDWKDICMPGQDYVIQLFPTSSLPQTPAARYQKVKEMMADGFIDKATAQRLLEYPDLEAEQNLGAAAIDDADETICGILDEAVPVLRPIEPYQNLELLLTRGTASYLIARRYKDIEPERLDLLRDLIDQVSALMEASMPPPAPMPGAPAPGGDMSMTGPQIDVNVAGGAAAPTVPPLLAA